MKAEKINWRKEYSHLWKQWLRMNKVAKKHHDDKLRVLKFLCRMANKGKFENESKTFVKEFNRVIKILQS